MIKRNELIRKKLHELVLEYDKSDVYLVGGFLRNELCGLQPESDIDLVCENPENFTSWLRYSKSSEVSRFTTHYKNSDIIGFSLVITGIKSPVWIECSRLSGRTLEEDSKKRDFCCNSIYQSLKTLKILDPTMKGLKDIKKKILRTPVSPEVTFQNDPLRLLRVFRFSGTLGFTISKETREGIKPYPGYYRLSLERIRREFSKILLSTQAVSIIRDLHEFDLLRYIIPQLSEGWGFNQNSKYHIQTLSDHLLGVLQFVIDDSKFSSESLRLAALLHDISKYREYQKKENGEYSYYGHEESSSNMAIQILERLGYPEGVKKEVSGLIRYHMILKPYGDPYGGSYKTTREILKKLMEANINSSKLMILIDGNNHNHSPKYNLPTQVESFLDSTKNVKKEKKSESISGNDIMRELGISEGKLVGEIKGIMTGYLEDDPSLGFPDLIKKYQEEFKDHTLWIWKQNDSWYASQEEPKKSPYPYGNYLFCESEIPVELESFSGYKDKYKYDAIQVPMIWRSIVDQKRSREIIYEAIKVLENLYEIDDFKSLSFTLDEYRDFSGVVRKYGKKPNYIL